MRVERFPMGKILIGSMALACLLFSCAEDKSATEEEDTNSKIVQEKSNNLFEVSGKIFSIPSPIQTAFLLKNSGAPYNSNMLAPTSKANQQHTSFEKALNLGIYGADLGYVTIYDQNQDAISYMAVSRKLATELGINNIFDEDLMNRFESNMGNQDSLMSMVSDVFKSSDKYLKETDQVDLSVMILAGGWIETLYFATHLAKESKNQSIINRIGEQKITIKNLIKLLIPFRSNESVGVVLNKLNELEDLYNDISFDYTYKEPTTLPDKKTTIINSESSVNLSENELQNITQKVREIREEILN